MGDREEFDRIVEHLDLDLSGLDEPDTSPKLPRSPADPAPADSAPADSAPADPAPPVVHPAARDDARSPDVDEQFYRRIDPPPPRGWKPGTAAAWAGVVGSPIALVAFTLLGFLAPRTVIVAMSLVFIGSAIYLIAQLPEHGPGRGDDPDDGAVL